MKMMLDNNEEEAWREFAGCCSTLLLDDFFAMMKFVISLTHHDRRLKVLPCGLVLIYDS